MVMANASGTSTGMGAEMTQLIVDDEPNLRIQLGKAMERRGFAVSLAESVEEGRDIVRAVAPKYAVIDLRLGDGSGLDVVETLRHARPEARIVMLTGYGNIATAVAAVKAGAVDRKSVGEGKGGSVR